MEINSKSDLVKEIEAFSKALYEYREIENEFVSQNEFQPYYSEHGVLKRVDYSGNILDEEAFLIFYGLFFDMIELNQNAEEVSNSQYFNTIYQTYRDKNKKELEELDLFMQAIKIKQEKEAISHDTDNKKEYNAIEDFLYNVLINKTRKQIKSSSNSEKFLSALAKKIKSNQDDRLIVIIFDLLLVGAATLITLGYGFTIIPKILIAAAVLLSLFYLFLFFSIYRITKQEKAELNQLPKNFKKYLFGESISLDKEFFNDKTTSYLDPLFKDSTIYHYVKAKYTKKESENGIINE